MTTFFSVKNYEKFQHYKDRAPPWIKLYNELLDDYGFGLLHDASKWHLIAIWLLASRSNNKIPFDAKWVAKKINATGTVDLRALVETGFIQLNQPLRLMAQDASTPQAECLSREREEVEERREEKKDIYRLVGETEFEDFWKIYPQRQGANPKQPAKKVFCAAVMAGSHVDEIIRGARTYASEISRNRTEGKFVAQAVTWLRQKRWQDYGEDAKNGHGRDYDHDPRL